MNIKLLFVMSCLSLQIVASNSTPTMSRVYGRPVSLAEMREANRLRNQQTNQSRFIDARGIIHDNNLTDDDKKHNQRIEDSIRAEDVRRERERAAQLERNRIAQSSIAQLSMAQPRTESISRERLPIS